MIMTNDAPVNPHVARPQTSQNSRPSASSAPKCFSTFPADSLVLAAVKPILAVAGFKTTRQFQTNRPGTPNTSTTCSTSPNRKTRR